MKTNKKLYLIFLALLVAGIGWQAAFSWPVESSGKSIETRPINNTQSTGGVAKHSQKSKPATDSNTRSGVATRKDLDKSYERAPKQYAITKTIQKEYTYRALLTSNDPLTASSWALDAIQASNAWDTSTGNGAVVAVIDSGFGLAHEDLVDRWHENSGETGVTAIGDPCWSGSPQDKSTNNCDDDANGYVDDWRGWSFIYSDNNPQAGLENAVGSGVSHGTEVAGLVGATGNNGVGIATLSWNNRVMPLQVLSDDGIGYTSDVVSAIYYAVDNGASVINMSLGGDGVDPAMRTALAYAYSHDVVVVAAAGNCGTDTEYGCDPAKPGTMSYPALEPSVIAVGAIDATNTRADFSSYGPQLDVVAPGSGSIRSTLWTNSNPTNAYAATLYGTSFASPFVASLAGLVKSIRPDTSVDDVTALIDATAQQPTSMNGTWYDNEYGHGIIDASSALDIATSLNANTVAESPVLMQTGNSRSEHSYSYKSTLESGCGLEKTTYCTVQMVDQTAGYRRYLPYKLVDSALTTDWRYKGSILLPTGAWLLHSQSGETKSASGYWLIQK